MTNLKEIKWEPRQRIGKRIGLVNNVSYEETTKTFDLSTGKKDIIFKNSCYEWPLEIEIDKTPCQFLLCLDTLGVDYKRTNTYFIINEDTPTAHREAIYQHLFKHLYRP